MWIIVRRAHILGAEFYGPFQTKEYAQQQGKLRFGDNDDFSVIKLKEI
jgi:hypothetical protein